MCQCSDKEVLLPVIAEGGISEIENHSSIWIFYDPNGQDSKAVLNKNNKLINTNWIFNIDRRLAMKDVIPLLQDMQADRNKDSMHKKEGMINYFSYADSKNERISLVQFPETSFVTMDDFSASNGTEIDSSSCLLMVRVYEDHLRVDGKTIELERLGEISNLDNGCKEGKTEVFRLMYDEDLSFQRYLETKAYFAAAQLTVDTTELVETLK
jgi:hypothetical protein